MSLNDWFANKKKKRQLDPNAPNDKLSDADFSRLWVQCFHCHAQLQRKDLTENQEVCPECGYHFRMNAPQRLNHLLSHPDDFFVEMDAELIPGDPLVFTDTQPYPARQVAAQKKSKRNEAVVTGLAQLDGQTLALGIMDFTYLGGSMGSVVGEKLTRLIEAALVHQLPLVLFTASGGARMQEGIFSLMQMVKTGAALARFHEAGLLYLTVLTEPTFGGVTASYGMLGDVILAEEGARIGFAGRRVIEQTIRQKLPADFQTAGYLLQYGQVDQVVHRHQLRHQLLQLINLHQQSSHVTPSSDIPLLSEKPDSQTIRGDQSVALAGAAQS